MRIRKRARAFITAAAVFCTMLLPVVPAGAETTKPTKIVVTTKVKNVAYAGTDSDVILALYDKSSKTEKTYKLDRAWWYNDFEKNAKDTYTVETEMYAWEISEVSIRIKGKDALRLDYVDWDMDCSGWHASNHIVVNTWLSNKESEKNVYLVKNDFNRNVTATGDFANAFEGTEYFAANDTTSGTRTFRWNCTASDQYGSNKDVFTLPQPPEITYNISGKGKVNGAIYDAAAIPEIRDAVKDVVYSGKDKTIGYTVDRQKLLAQMKAKGIYKLSITANLRYSGNSTNINKISSQSRTFTFIRPQFVLSDKDTAITTTPYTAGRDNYYFNSTVGTVTAKIAVLSDSTYMGNYNANDIAKNIAFSSARLYYGRGSSDYVELKSKSVSGNTVLLNFDMSSVRRNDDNTGLQLKLEGVTSTYNGQTFVLSGSDYSRLFTSYKTDTLAPEVTASAADGAALSGVWRTSLTVNPSVNEEVYPKLSSSIPFDDLPMYKNVFSAELTGPGTNKSKNVAAAGASTLTLECDKNIESDAFALKLTAYDFAGNKTVTTYNNICLDRKAPTIKLSDKADFQQADLSKAVMYKFAIEELSGTARLHYCLVPSGSETPEVNNEQAQSGTIETLLNKWAFIDQKDIDNSSVILRVANNDTFEGTLVYFAEDALGNRSDTVEQPIYVSNVAASADIVIGDYTYPKQNYDISFISGADTNVYFRYNGIGTRYKLYEPGKTDVGSSSQTDDNGNSVTLNGKQLLEYKAVNSQSGNTIYFEGTKGKTLLFDNTPSDITIAQDNYISSKAERTIKVKASDISPITEATYKVLSADYGITAINDTALEINNGLVNDSARVAGIANGRYVAEVSVTDANGNKTTAEGSIFNIRSQKPTASAAVKDAPDKDGAALISSHGYTITMDVDEDYICPGGSAREVVKYRASADGVNFGPWTEAGDLFETASGYSAHGIEIDTPLPLNEGANSVYLQVMCTESGKDVSAVTETEPSVLVLDPLNVFIDAEGPEYNLSYDITERTNKPITATVTLKDNISHVFTLASTSPAAVVTPDEDASDKFYVEISEPGTIVEARDEAGNVTEIILAAPNLDVTPPTIGFNPIDAVQNGARVDGSTTVVLFGADPESVSFAPVLDGETFDGTYDAVEIKNVSIDYVDNFEDEDGVSMYSQNYAFGITVKGLTGNYHIGVVARDDLGNETVAVSEEVAALRDATPAITGVSAPGTAVGCAGGSISFNVPVYVLPQSEMIAQSDVTALYGEDEIRTADEINKDKAVLEALENGTSQTIKYNFPQNATGNYNLIVADDVGRAYNVQCHIDTEFIEGYDLTLDLRQIVEMQDSEGNSSTTETQIGEGGVAYVGLDESDDDLFKQCYVRLYVSSNAPADKKFYLYPHPLDENGNEIEEGSYTPQTPFSMAGVSGTSAELDPQGNWGYKSMVMDIMTYDFEAFDIRESKIKTLNIGAKIFEDGVEKPIIQNYSVPFSNIITAKPEIIMDITPTDSPAREVTVTVDAVDQNVPIKNIRAVEMYTESEEFQRLLEEKEAELDEDAFWAWYEAAIPEAMAEAKTYNLAVTEENKTLTFTVDRNTMFYVSATNEYGLTASESFTVNNINSDELKDEDVFVTYEIKRDGEWIADDGETYTKEARAVVYYTDENNSRLIYVKNNGGNAAKTLTAEYPAFTYILGDGYGYEIEKSVEFSRFDLEGPEINYFLDNTEKTNQPVKITITAADSASGLASLSLSGSGGEIPLTESEGFYTADILSSGNYVIKATDRTGNTSSKAVSVTNIDTNAPSMNFSLDTYSYTRKGVTASLTFSKNGVSITHVEPVEGSAITTSDYTCDFSGRKIRFTNNGSLAVQFVDEYGNIGTGIVTVTNIFTAPPTLMAVPVLADDGQSVSVTFDKQRDEENIPLDMVRELSELYVFYGGTAYKVVDDNGTPATFVLRQNGDYTFTVYDEAGSMQYITLKVTDIDSETPQITQISWEYEYLSENGAGFTQNTETGSYNPGAGEIGYVIASDKNPKTNFPVEITVTTDKPTAFMGSVDPEYATEHKLTYRENGMYVFNLKKTDDLSVSYGVDVELIDKTPPTMAFSGNPDMMYLQGVTQYNKADLLDCTASDTFANVTTDLTDKITIDWGGFDPDNFAANKFDKNKPYTVTYTVYDSVGNKTELKRKITLLGINDTVVTVNGEIPDANSDIVTDADSLALDFINFSGTSYAKYIKGNYTFGQMKTMGEVINKDTDGKYKVSGLTEGWYTFFVQTDKRDYFNIHVYINK